MSNILEWLSVLGTGILELWAAILLGLAFKIHPILTGTLSAVGSIISTLIVIFFASSIRNWLIHITQGKNKGRARNMNRIWAKYGIVGIGFLSPLITGSLLGAAIGISFGAEPRKLFIWMTIGIIFWSAVLTTVAALGFNAFLFGN
ncbi:putative membrane protein [Paenibacillus shirakamiensis]|uniref:Membrane protein n=1 Tax=Paenibacillus shirakamiensis TaxID=1265935 RepID=A0ABS4JEJ2_9BACL|nr:small multi-drug export protein [Paenibacillus shirakamiensis]MBP2000133.1 putative membrane protein [Paenibacillus shirakamiensis]